MIKQGEWVKNSDIDGLKNIDPISMEDVENMQEILNPVIENATEIGITSENVKKIKLFFIKLKTRLNVSQRGEQFDYEHGDQEDPTSVIDGDGSPSDKSKAINSGSGISTSGV